MKRLVSILSIILSLTLLCSCANITVPYEYRSDINLNYNNISSDAYSFWLTPNSYCYRHSDDLFIDDYYCVEGYEQKRIKTHSRGTFTKKIQRYDDMIYMLSYDDVNPKEEKHTLEVYNTHSKIVKTVFKVKNCYDFLVVGDTVYYITYKISDKWCYSLKKYTEKAGHETICVSVISFGVIGDKLFYLTEDHKFFTIFEYDEKNNTSVEHGDFSLPQTSYGHDCLIVPVSYTPEHILIIADAYHLNSDEEDDTSYIFNYSLHDNLLSEIRVDYVIDSFIAYKNNSFFSGYKTDEAEGTHYLFKFDNQTNQIEKMGEADICDIFVGSDEGVYVRDDNSITYYETGKAPLVVFNKKSWI